MRYKSSFINILIKACSFFTFIHFIPENEKKIDNQIHKFIQSDVINKNMNLKDESIDTNDFIKCLKKNIDYLKEEDNNINPIKEMIRDYSFCSSLYKKFEELLNLFFDQ